MSQASRELALLQTRLRECYTLAMATTARRYTAILHKEGDLYVAECQEIGTASQGCTVEEALANLKEATELYVEEFYTESTDSCDLLEGHDYAGPRTTRGESSP